jgi:hypothetical protein
MWRDGVMAANAPHDDLDTAGSQARDILVAGMQFAVLTGWLASKLRSTHSMRAMSNRAK